MFLSIKFNAGSQGAQKLQRFHTPPSFNVMNRWLSGWLNNTSLNCFNHLIASTTGRCYAGAGVLRRFRLAKPHQEGIDVRRYAFVSAIRGTQRSRCRSTKRIQYPPWLVVLVDQFFNYLYRIRRCEPQPAVPTRVRIELVRVVRSLSYLFFDNYAHVGGVSRVFRIVSISARSVEVFR